MYINERSNSWLNHIFYEQLVDVRFSNGHLFTHGINQLGTPQSDFNLCYVCNYTCLFIINYNLTASLKSRIYITFLFYWLNHTSLLRWNFRGPKCAMSYNNPGWIGSSAWSKVRRQFMFTLQRLVFVHTELLNRNFVRRPLFWYHGILLVMNNALPLLYILLYS